MTFGKDVIIIECKKQILAAVLKEMLKAMTRIIPAFCHSDNKQENELNKEDYLSKVDDSTLLLKSFAFQISDFILWYRNYLKDNSNFEENADNWDIKDYKAANIKK